MELCVFFFFFFFFVSVASESLAELSSSTSIFEAKSMFFRRFLQDTRSFSFDVSLSWVLSVVFFLCFLRVVFESLSIKFVDFTRFCMAC
jgi:hypothetical protein